MAFNYLNGVQVGLENWDGGNPNYCAGPRQAWRLLYLWLIKVVGWASVDTQGSRWNDPKEAQTDGATDASLPYKFTSATADFVTNCIVGDHLLVCPTAAPATAGGFTDATRNGFYRIDQIIDANTVYVDTWSGVDTDGLPLGESGLNFEVHRFTDPSNTLPQNDDFWVARGTGTGGDFDLYCLNNSIGNYGYAKFSISPWDDWDAGAHAWKTPARYTTETYINNSPHTDICWCYGFADLTQAFFYYKGFGFGFDSQWPQYWYFGDIEPFNASDDPRPVVLIYGSPGNTTLENQLNYMQSNVRMIGPDLNVVDSGKLIRVTYYNGSSTGILTQPVRNRSYYSGKLIQLPLLVGYNGAGQTELRGRLKNVYNTNTYGARFMTPIGDTLDAMKFGDLTFPWNGSKQFRYLY
jgi:hypothetical protein